MWPRHSWLRPVTDEASYRTSHTRQKPLVPSVLKGTFRYACLVWYVSGHVVCIDRIVWEDAIKGLGQRDATNNSWVEGAALIGHSFRPRPHVSGYFWIRNFFFPDTASVHSESVRWIRQTNPQLFESALHGGNFWKRYESRIVWTLYPDIFFMRWPNKIERSCLPWILYSRWQPCCQGLSLTHLYDARSVANIPIGVLGTRVNPDTCRILVDGQILFEYGYVWKWKYWIQTEKLAHSKL